MSKSSINLWGEYEKWLLNQINFRKKGYNLLIDMLHNSAFEVFVERDSNRLQDGASYRGAFFGNIGVIDGNFSDHPIGILEVLVAFAIRIDTDYIGDPGNPHPEILFWEMLCNLGLNKYDDNHFNSDEVYNILAIWITRNYNYNGFGGIFPLKNARNDQKEVELWRQMMAYFNEKCF